MDIRYKVEKLRCLNAMDYVEIKPITLLVGLNNSGKSSFLRSLPLLKQSLESKFNTPISWRGDIVDFGSFDDAISKKYKKEKNCNEIKFCFNISNLEFRDNLSNRSGFFRYMLQKFCNKNFLPSVYYEINVAESIEKADIGNTIYKNIKIIIPKLVEFLVVFSEDGNCIENIHIDNVSIFDLLNIKRMTPVDNYVFLNEFSFEFRNKHEGAIDIFDIVYQIEYLLNFDGPFKSQDILFSKELMEVLRKFPKKFRQYSTRGKMSRDSFEQYRKGIEDHERHILHYLGFFYLFFVIAKNTNFVFNSFLSQMSYLGPVRAGNVRYQPFQEYGVNQIDPQGKNLPYFLNSLSDEQRHSFESWVSNFFDFTFKTRRIEGHIVMEVQFENEDFNIVDTGFGISQILPVLAQIWWAKHKPYKLESFVQDRRYPRMKRKIDVFRTLLMEQPELHLHADPQAVLGSAIVSVANSKETDNIPNPRFIIETQSEELVSQFSNAIYEREISHNDVQVIMFNSLDPKIPIDSSVEIYKFDKEGMIEDWPFGFFNPRR